jgi:hypothetical protein
MSTEFETRYVTCEKDLPGALFALRNSINAARTVEQRIKLAADSLRLKRIARLMGWGIPTFKAK